MWYAVVIEAEVVPDVLGPFRSRANAKDAADEWNTAQDDLFRRRLIESTSRAFVVPMVRDLSDLTP
jgi:hypothetical protein